MFIDRILYNFFFIYKIPVTRANADDNLEIATLKLRVKVIFAVHNSSSSVIWTNFRNNPASLKKSFCEHVFQKAFCFFLQIFAYFKTQVRSSFAMDY